MFTLVLYLASFGELFSGIFRAFAGVFGVLVFIFPVLVPFLSHGFPFEVVMMLCFVRFARSHSVLFVMVCSVGTVLRVFSTCFCGVVSCVLCFFILSLVFFCFLLCPKSYPRQTTMSF